MMQFDDTTSAVGASCFVPNNMALTVCECIMCTLFPIFFFFFVFSRLRIVVTMELVIVLFRTQVRNPMVKTSSKQQTILLTQAQCTKQLLCMNIDSILSRFMLCLLTASVADTAADGSICLADWWSETRLGGTAFGRAQRCTASLEASHIVI